MYMSKMQGSGNIYQNVIAVTNRHLCSRPLTEQVERICRCHPKAVILREKDLTEEAYTDLAGEIITICRNYEIPCILHTFVNAAKTLNCSAIHLPLPLLREYAAVPDLLSCFTTVGTSVHSADDALEAVRLGASYVTAGHIYTTDCKKGIPPRGLEFLRKICQIISLPVYAIGGIKADEHQLSEVIHCGAKGGCIMSGMMEV